MKKYALLFLPLFLFAKQPITPIPIEVDVDMPKAKLGQELFFDTILSSDNSVACLSCHNVYEGGADPRVVSIGVKGRKGNIQSPTVLNARYNFRQFWNGRAADLKEQATGPLNNPAEHNMDPQKIEKKLNNSPYKQKFHKVFHTNKVKYENVLDAIVEFEKALTTPNAKFDKFLRGEYQLSKNEKQGYILFKQYGCITCHNGVNLGGNSYQKMGTFVEYKNTQTYPDRSQITKKPFDINVFKVPTLRNIVKTAPYFHDGSAKSLKDALQTMAKYNLGIEFQEQEIKDLVEFFKTLSGERPKILDSANDN